MSLRFLLALTVALHLGSSVRADSGLDPGLYGTELNGRIHRVDRDTGATTLTLTLDLAGSGLSEAWDITFDAAGDLLVLDGPNLRIHRYDAASATLSVVAACCAQQNALGTRSSDDALLASGGTSFFVQGRAGDCPTTVGLPRTSAGDVAEGPDGRVFVSAADAFGGDFLLEVDVAAGSARVVGTP